MENRSPECVKDSQYDFYSSSDEEYWYVHCSRRFRLNHHHHIQLMAMEDEGLNKVIFDTERKTVEVTVSSPTAVKWPRVADISDNPEFFEDLRANIETILITGGYTSVTPNEDRTVFEVR